MSPIPLKKRRIKPFRPVYPSPAALITCVDAKGNPNIITLGETFNVSVSDPVILGIAIAPARYSHGLISESREFTINLPTADILEAMDRCGNASGRKVKDKFSAYGLTPLPASEIRAPLIAECPVNIECRLLSVQTVGDHDLFLGEAAAVHVDEDKLTDDDNILTDRLGTIVFMHWEYWSLGQKLGHLGYSVGRKPRN